MEAIEARKVRARGILRKLVALYPDAECALHFTTPLELLVATILAAQCTDVRVNLITPALFAHYRTARDYAAADPDELQEYIRSINFYRNKTKSIQLCCQQLVERHGGAVPGTMAELVELQGVGRKTANVLLSNAFGVPGITVDTHVGRLSRRLGLSAQTDPEKVERDLMELLPKKRWSDFSHALILHGRQVCHARKPSCDECGLEKLCPKIGV